MEKRYCYGCMKQITEPVCPHCGHPENGVNAPHQRKVGTVLEDRYLVGRAVFQSPTAIGYIGLDQEKGDTVLLRECFPQGAQRQEDGSLTGDLAPALERFRQEATAMNIVEIIRTVSASRGFFEADGTVYAVTDNVRGPSLGRYVAMRGGKLALDETLRLLQPVLEAVAALHRGGLVHGNVHMQTIFLDPLGGARLLGFGENPAAGPEDDVYAFCRVFCGCLNEQAQHQAVNPADIPELPPEMAQALAIGLAPDPRQRFASAAALQKALLGPTPGQAEPAAVPEKAEEAPPVQPDEIQPTQKADEEPPAIPAQAPEEAPEAPKAAPDSIAPTELITDFKVAPPEAPKAAPEQPMVIPVPSAPVEEEEIPLGRPVRPEPPVPPRQPEPPVKRRGKGIVIALVAIAVILLALLVGFFTIHTWEDATCDAPRTCSLCGKTEGEPLSHRYTALTCTEDSVCEFCGEVKETAPGHPWQEADCRNPKTCSVCGQTEGTPQGHDWEEATCYAAKTCSVCGETDGSPLGHDWEDATYTKPETCSRCGLTRGNIRGYYAEMEGDWERLRYGTTTTYAVVCDIPVRKCRGFTLDFEPEFSGGTYVREWKVMYRDGSNNWHEAKRFSLGSSGTGHVEINFSGTPYVSAVMVIPVTAGSYSYNFDFWVTDVYYYE